MYILYLFILILELLCMHVSDVPYFQYDQALAQLGSGIHGIIQECNPHIKQGITVYQNMH
jgi:hypothetical protein